MSLHAVTISEHDQPHDAHVVLSALKLAGIHAWLEDEYTVRLGECPGRVKVVVRPEDAEWARAVVAVGSDA